MRSAGERPRESKTLTRIWLLDVARSAAVTYDEGSEDVGLEGVGVRPARSCGHGGEDGVTGEPAEVAGGAQRCDGLL